MSSALEMCLAEIGCGDLLEPLEGYGVESPEDLCLLDEEDLATLCAKLKKVPARKFQDLVKRQLDKANSPQQHLEPAPQPHPEKVVEPPPQQHLEPAPEPQPHPEKVVEPPPQPHPERVTLLVSMVSASGLPSASAFWKISPYVQLRKSGETDTTYKTEVIQSCQTPNWKRGCVLMDCDPGEMLELDLAVMDKNSFYADGVLGETSCAIKVPLPVHGFDKELALSRSGNLRVKIERFCGETVFNLAEKVVKCQGPVPLPRPSTADPMSHESSLPGMIKHIVVGEAIKEALTEVVGAAEDLEKLCVDDLSSPS